MTLFLAKCRLTPLELNPAIAIAKHFARQSQQNSFTASLSLYLSLQISVTVAAVAAKKL